MDALPEHFAVRPDPAAVDKRPKIVAQAVAMKLAKDIPVASIEPGTAFDKAMRETLAKIEQAFK